MRKKDLKLGRIIKFSIPRSVLDTNRDINSFQLNDFYWIIQLINEHSFVAQALNLHGTLRMSIPNKYIKYAEEE